MAATLLDQFRENVEPGRYYDDGSTVPTLPAKSPVRLIAFHLPQFHAIPENDEWWGPGFTEWTNVTRALPLFPDHYQPRLPGAFGFYDLSRPEVLRRQAETARRYGIEGFCFHHYWFGGRRLLERPLENLLADKSIDLPFCVNWANENWTRRWDGRESQVLMAQDHSLEDDVAFARSLEPLLDDPRYIRVGGRPLVMLYRPAILPNAAETVERWRAHFATRGEQPLFLMAQVFGDYDPRPYGMDGAVGFPPSGGSRPTDPIFPKTLFDPDFAGGIWSYDEVALASLAYRPSGFKHFPGVCPAWDNTPRRGPRGEVLQGSTPAKYGAWLDAAARQAMQSPEPDERIVFINAWNEWAESAYLEPDRHFGFAYLRETAAALARIAADPNASVDPATVFRTQGSVQPTPAHLRLVRRLTRRGARVAQSFARALSSI